MTRRRTFIVRRTIAPLLGAVLTAGSASAQEPSASAPEPLTLRSAVERALAGNRDIQIEREALAGAAARIIGARGEYDPRLSLEFGARHRLEPITTLFSGAPAGAVAPSQNSFSATVSVGQLLPSGAVASAFTSFGRQATNGLFTLIDPAFSSALGFDLRQPLMRSRNIDSARLGLRLTAIDRDRSMAEVRAQAAETLAAVERAYWTLVAARRELEVRRESVALAEQQRAETEVRVAARTVAASDVAQPIAEAERRRGEWYAAQERAARAERALKLLIVSGSDDPLWSAALDPVDRPEIQPAAVDVNLALADAQRHRPELEALGAGVAAEELQVSLALDMLRPRLDLVGSYTTRGLAGSRNPDVLALGGAPTTLPEPLSGGAATSWAALLNNRFPDLSVGLSFELPLGRREARGQIGAAQAARRQATARLASLRDRIEIEVRDAVTAVETAAGRVDAARAGLRAAETQLRAEQDRFTAGVTTNFFVLTRQAELAVAQLAEVT
ncbi:MAG: hypothetical protein GEU82_13070, partial [Luteitalea sp.]|nr:hypothetical protein [Luteitalea sp.]